MLKHEAVPALVPRLDLRWLRNTVPTTLIYHPSIVMLWRLPPSVRSLLISSPHRYSSTKTTGPLRILFCGSDEFSIKSLRALNDAKHARQDLVKSIDVVHRPGKRTGRGLKVVREGKQTRNT